MLSKEAKMCTGQFKASKSEILKKSNTRGYSKRNNIL